MIKLALLLIPLLMVGCNSTDSNSDPSLDGTYQNTEIALDGSVVMQWIFSGGNSYQAKIYVARNDGTMNCLIAEGMGKWTLAADALRLTEAKARSRQACADTLSDWVDRPSKSDPIRNINAQGFEMYLSADDNTPAQWIGFVKL
jgi:hypothetical protein